MLLESVRTFFDHSPAIRLLKSDHGAFVVDFLFQTFKQPGFRSASELSHDELMTRLTMYQEELWQTDSDKLIGKADRYLLNWSDAGWLSRFLPAAAPQHAYQLTPAAEDAIRFVDNCLSRQGRMVGTESRLRLVIETLGDLAHGASGDPDARLQRLRKQRDELDQEIAIIESGGPVDVYQPAKIRERFHLALQLLKALQGDFRAVEDHFYTIAQQVHCESQTTARRRGEILESALDSEDLLKEQDEGISFYAFVAFLFSPDAQLELRQTIDEVTDLDAIARDAEGIEHLRAMVPSLLTEAEKVLRTTGRLSQTLRRLLDSDTASHRKRVADVLKEIQTTAASIKQRVALTDEELPADIGLTIETSLGIDAPLSRELWKAPQTFDDIDPADQVVDLEKAQQAARKMARFRRLDYPAMRRAIEKATAEQAQLSMSEFLKKHPPKAGVMELVGLLQVAREDGHRIDQDAKEEIVIKTKQPAGGHSFVRVLAPLVTFIRQGDQVRQRKPR